MLFPRGDVRRRARADPGDVPCPPGDVFRSSAGMPTRFTSGGVINPSDAPPEVAPATGTARGDASGPGKPTGTRSNGSPAGFSGRPHANAGRPAGASAAMNASNVGFRMLRNAGWNVGEGLGKTKQGATEPLRVVRKTSRRGVGGDDQETSRVIGNLDETRSVAGKGHAKRPRPSDERDGAREAAETKALGTKNVGDEKRRRAAAADAFARAAGRAFDAPSADADVNPLLRRRARDHTGNLSANNPLRGLF